MNITSTKTAAVDQGIKILVHGQPGAGKTRLCGTTGSPETTLILSAEAGLLSLREHDIDVVRIDSIDTLRDAYVAIRDQQTEKQYNWVCLDSISEIAEVCLDEKFRETMTPDGKENGMRAYGELGKTMAKLIRLFRDLPGVNVYMSAKQERVETETGLIWAPMLPGSKLSQNIAYWFDEVFALRTRDTESGVVRKLQTSDDGHFQCKDRSGALEMFESPNLEAIQKKITNTITEG